MPKGALLHVHLEATLNAEVLLRLALQQPAIHVSAAMPIDASTFMFPLPQFKAFPEDYVSDGPGLTDPSYVGNSWVPIRKARDTFDQNLGGPAAFDAWVTKALTINLDDAYETYNTVCGCVADMSFRADEFEGQIWMKFQDTFQVSTVCRQHSLSLLLFNMCHAAARILRSNMGGVHSRILDSVDR
jgi:adenosine deaminase CECR1